MTNISQRRSAHSTVRPLALLVALWGMATAGVPSDAPPTDPGAASTTAKIDSLSQLSIESLRKRSFDAQFTLQTTLGTGSGQSDYAKFYGPPFYSSFIASYLSDGLRVYARVDVPPVVVASPSSGFPVILFAHGWVGEAAAPGFDFDYTPNSYYGDLIDRYVKAGYVVVTPGYRGHGRVNDVPSQGIEYVRTYDDGSYLAPQFYAIDILHALQAVGSLEGIQWPTSRSEKLRIDRSRIYLSGHSQGGDAAFTALAVSSSPQLHQHFRAASIWAGCIAGRMEQGGFYGPMETSEAALHDPAYFPHMPPQWKARQYTGTIQQGIDGRRQQMYRTVRNNVADQAHADLNKNSLLGAMRAIDAVAFPQFITVPLDLHFSDRDYFSTPQWNSAVVRSIRSMGGRANAYVYPGNGHDLRLVDGWSPRGSSAGRETAIARTLERFK